METEEAMTQTTTRRDVAAILQSGAAQFQNSSATPDTSSNPLTTNELKNTVLGVGMREDQLDMLASLGERRCFEPRQVIVAPDDKEFPLMVLLAGKAKVFGMFEDLVNVIEPGSLIGEVAFLDEKNRTATVLAQGSCEVAVFSPGVIATLNAERPDIVSDLLYNIARELCTKLRTAQRLINATDATGNYGRSNTPLDSASSMTDVE